MTKKKHDQNVPRWFFFCSLLLLPLFLGFEALTFCTLFKKASWPSPGTELSSWLSLVLFYFVWRLYFFFSPLVLRDVAIAAFQLQISLLINTDILHFVITDVSN